MNEIFAKSTLFTINKYVFIIIKFLIKYFVD